jgi:hypothetical protein
VLACRRVEKAEAIANEVRDRLATYIERFGLAAC